MRHITACIGLIISFSSFSQITITSSDLPGVGDTLRYATSSVNNFDGNDTGPNHVWDYSMLASNGSGADTVIGVSGTPFLYQFFFNNPFLYPAHNADHSFRGSDLDFQAITVDDVYDYYKSGASSYENVGFGATINGLPSSVQRNPVDQVYALPMDYADSSTSFSAFELNVPGIVFIRQEQNRTNEVDGWGTLSLPSGTHDVLRVKTTLDRVDSIYVNTLMFGFSLPEPQTIEYKWLAQNEHRPVLQITTVLGLVTSVQFSSSVVNSISAEPYEEFKLFPNPSSDKFRLYRVSNESMTAVMFAGTGQPIMVQTVGKTSDWDITGLSAGLYYLKVGSRTVKILVAD